MMGICSMPLQKRRIVIGGISAVISFLLMVLWSGHIRPLGSLFLLILCFWFYKTRCNLRIVAPPELQKKYEQFTERVVEWRRNQPAMFCAVSSGCLGALAIIGHLISGSAVVLMGLVVAAIVSTKYNFKLVKIEYKDFTWAEKMNHDPELDDDFLPEVNESTLFVLERASDFATICSPIEDADAEEDEKSDDIPAELLIPDVIPEVGEQSSDEDINELVPVVKQQKIDEGKKAATADSELIAFKKGHFKRDSSLSTTSSSSEESLSKGLQFPDHTTVDGPAVAILRQTQVTPHNQEAVEMVAATVKSQTQSLIENSSKLLPNLVSNIVQWGMSSGGVDDAAASTSAASATSQTRRRVVTASDSSDDSDFEILDNEDFK